MQPKREYDDVVVGSNGHPIRASGDVIRLATNIHERQVYRRETARLPRRPESCNSRRRFSERAPSET